MLVDQPGKLTNVQQLLDQLGTPPPEVCLDWAWQLLNQSAPSEGQFARLSHTTQTSLETHSDTEPILQWSDWLLTECGELKFEQQMSGRLAQDALLNSNLRSETELTERNCNNTIDSLSRARLVVQLLDWAGAAWQENSDRYSPEEQLLAFSELKTKLDKANIALRQNPDARLPLGKQRFETAVTLRPKKGKRPILKRPFRLTMLVIGLSWPILLIGTYLYWNRFHSDTSSTSSDLAVALVSGTSLPDTLKPNNSGQPTTTTDEKTESSAFQLSDNISGLSTPSSSEAVLQTIDLSILSDADSDYLNTSSMEPPQTGHSRSSVAESLEGLLGTPEPSPPSNLLSKDTAGQNAQVATSVDDGASVAGLIADAEIDTKTILSNAVSELTKGMAPSQPEVMEISVESNANGTQTIPAPMISTSATMQVQKLPDGYRVKEPSWQLRLIPSDSFNVEPKTPQRLWDRVIVSWTLLPNELSKRKSDEMVQVLVQAQLAGRRPDIRWKITASPRDLPVIVLPLDSGRLEQMFDLLTEQQWRTRAALEQAKLGGSQPGVPKELRTLLFNRRRVLEEQNKVLQRLEQIIADASLYATWLGESIEVHGILIDKSLPDQPLTVLQLGDGISSALEATNR